MKRVIYILTLLLLTVSASAQNQHQSDVAEIYFDLNSYTLSGRDSNSANNKKILDALVVKIKSLEGDGMASIEKIIIDSYTSPEGSAAYNNRLAAKRADAIYDYLSKYIDFSRHPFEKRSTGVDWEEFKRLVADSETPHKEEVLAILENEEPDLRIKEIMKLHGGESYKYLKGDIFPALRRGTVPTVYYRRVVPDCVGAEIEHDPIPTYYIPTTAPRTPVMPPPFEYTPEPKYHPVAIKSNLLFDAVTLANIEVEVPIGERFSVAGEWIFPWWTWDDGTANSKRNRIQLLNGNIEGKYWFGDRTDRPQLTGWYAGFYAGGGLYDFERSAEGYQGEFFIAAGISGGYAHTINKRGNLRMEYSVGLGYLKTDYRYYEALYNSSEGAWSAVRRRDGNYTWIGPTKLRASLVWIIGDGKGKKGGKQ